MSSLKLKTPSGGSVSFNAEDTGSDYTLTVPAGNANVLTNATAGTVLQVVQSSYSIEVSTTSTSYIDSGLSASITPSSTSSKILVLASVTGAITSDNHLHLAIFRNSTMIHENTSAFFAQTAGVSGTSISLSTLDSPSTTSSTTYSVKLKSRDTSENVRTAYGSGINNIILMEIAG